MRSDFGPIAPAPSARKTGRTGGIAAEQRRVTVLIRSHYPKEYDMSSPTTIALAMLRESPEYLQDAREGAPVGNSVVGSLLSLVHRVPRQYAEQAVLDAIEIIDAE